MSESQNAAPTAEKSRFKSIIELTSFLGSIGFVTSAIVNEFVFRSWGLSYLAICSVQDVVLGGVQLLILAMLSLPLIAMFIILSAAIMPALRASWHAGLRWMILLPILILVMVISGVTWWLPPDRVGVLPWATATFVVALLAWLPTVGVISGFAPHADWRDAWMRASDFVAGREKTVRFVVVVIVMVLGAGSIYRSMTLDLTYGRGVLTTPATLPASLATRCTGREVVWIGSDRLLIRCGQTFVALQDKATSDIILSPRSFSFFSAGR